MYSNISIWVRCYFIYRKIIDFLPKNICFDLALCCFDSELFGFGFVLYCFDSKPFGFGLVLCCFDSKPFGFSLVLYCFDSKPFGFGLVLCCFDSKPFGFGLVLYCFDSKPFGLGLQLCFLVYKTVCCSFCANEVVRILLNHFPFTYLSYPPIKAL